MSDRPARPDAQLSELLESLGRTEDGVYAVDQEHRIVFWNAAAERLLGYRASEVIGRHCYDIVAGEDAHRGEECSRDCMAMQLARKAVGTPSLTARVIAKDGSEKWLHPAHLSLSSGREGAAGVMVHLFHEITRERRAEELVLRLTEFIAELEPGVDLEPGRGRRQAAPASRGATLLSPGELEVLQLLSRGMGTREVARSLVVTPATARNHIQNVLTKLNVHTRLEAVAYGLRHGFITGPSSS